MKSMPGWLLLLNLIGGSAAASTLIYCPASAPLSLNPQLAIDQASFDATHGTIYEGLVRLEQGTSRIVPALAESWEITENGRVFTFQLRREVQFQRTDAFRPGRPFNASDVLFSFERQWRPDHPYHTVSGGTYHYFDGMGWPRRVLALDRLDPYTVQFTLNQPDAGFLALLAMPFAAILSAEYAAWLRLSGALIQLDLQPVGTGPFRLTRHEPGQRLVYAAHEGYWGERPSLDGLVIAPEPDLNQRIARLTRAECHLLAPLSRAERAAFGNPRGIQMLRQTGFDIGYLAFNTRRPPLDDVRVRQALALAVDRQAILQVGYGADGRLAENPLPPTSWAYDDTVEPMPYDPERARDLLAEAGVETSGVETSGVEELRLRLWVPPVERDYLPDAAAVARLIRADWALLGIDVELVTPDWETFLAGSRVGEHDVILLGWVGDSGDPDNFLSPLLSCAAVNGGNRARWCQPTFEELLHQARLTAEPEARRALYQQVQALFREQLPWLPLAHSLRHQPLRGAVRGFSMGVLGASQFPSVELR